MYLVACGVSGFGDWIWETDSGRPFGISTLRLWLSRRDSLLDDGCLLLEECLDERELFSLSEWCFDELDLEEDDLPDDLSCGTSRMFKTRPVVGSVVDDCPGSWDTWYPSMM
jgi:hypothetical protein